MGDVNGASDISSVGDQGRCEDFIHGGGVNAFLANFADSIVTTLPTTKRVNGL